MLFTCIEVWAELLSRALPLSDAFILAQHLLRLRKTADIVSCSVMLSILLPEYRPLQHRLSPTFYLQFSFIPTPTRHVHYLAPPALLLVFDIANMDFTYCFVATAATAFSPR